jgi:hypothetical protein
MTTFQTTIRIDNCILNFRDSEWLKEKLFEEFPKFFKELSLCSFILVEDVSIYGAKASHICYVDISVEIFDDIAFRKLKIKYPSSYQKFLEEPRRKDYEIIYNASAFNVYKLKGEYL